MSAPRSLRSGLAALPTRAQDALLAAVVAAVDVSLLWLHDPVLLDVEGFTGPSLRGVLVLLLLAAPLTWRRAAPHLVAGATFAGSVAAIVARVPTQLFPPLVALYTLGAYRPRRESLPWLAASAVLAAVLMAWLGELEFLLGQLVILATAWLLGDRARAHRERDAVLRDRAEQLERERELAAVVAASEERTRVARELHDVLAHSVSLMVVQAAAARRVLDADRERARGAVAQIVATGEGSLAELRRMVGVLGADGSDGRPPPGLDELSELVDGFRRAGLPVELDTRGTPRPLAAGVELSAYRIVQESLTNVLKHAGGAASATVRLAYEDAALAIDVADDGRGAAAARSEGGHGIAGMRERALMLGGTLDAAPQRVRGFRVRAVLPTVGTA